MLLPFLLSVLLSVVAATDAATAAAAATPAHVDAEGAFLLDHRRNNNKNNNNNVIHLHELPHQQHHQRRAAASSALRHRSGTSTSSTTSGSVGYCPAALPVSLNVPISQVYEGTTLPYLWTISLTAPTTLGPCVTGSSSSSSSSGGGGSNNRVYPSAYVQQYVNSSSSSTPPLCEAVLVLSDAPAYPQTTATGCVYHILGAVQSMFFHLDCDPNPSSSANGAASSAASSLASSSFVSGEADDLNNASSYISWSPTVAVTALNGTSPPFAVQYDFYGSSPLVCASPNPPPPPPSCPAPNTNSNNASIVAALSFSGEVTVQTGPLDYENFDVVISLLAPTSFTPPRDNDIYNSNGAPVPPAFVKMYVPGGNATAVVLTTFSGGSSNSASSSSSGGEACSYLYADPTNQYFANITLACDPHQAPTSGLRIDPNVVVVVAGGGANLADGLTRDGSILASKKRNKQNNAYASNRGQPLRRRVKKHPFVAGGDEDWSAASSDYAYFINVFSSIVC